MMGGPSLFSMLQQVVAVDDVDRAAKAGSFLRVLGKLLDRAKFVRELLRNSAEFRVVRHHEELGTRVEHLARFEKW